MTGDVHVPVLADRIVDLLAPALDGPDAVYVDGTLGLGGHAAAMLTAAPKARLLGIDTDSQAIAVAAERLAPFGDRVTLVQARYDEMSDVLADQGIDQVAGVLLDLGLSSLQIDRTERGFSYATDAPLDMRMNADGARTAADVVNTATASELARLLRRYGDERFADRIASRIVAARQTQPFISSAQLVATITEAIPAAARYSGGHPAKRTFQALRIAVNDELESLASVLPQALAALAVGGRMAVLAYHSGEDRLVKQAFRDATTSRAPHGLPVVPEGYGPQFQLLTRGAERPDATEIESNPRAASARLRAVERNAADVGVPR